MCICVCVPVCMWLWVVFPLYAQVEAILERWSQVLRSIGFLLPEDLNSLVHREAQVRCGVDWRSGCALTTHLYPSPPPLSLSLCVCVCVRVCVVLCRLSMVQWWPTN